MILDLPELAYEYALAGLRVFSNRRVQQPEAPTAVDGQVIVFVGEMNSDLKQFANMLDSSRDVEEWVTLVEQEGVTVRQDGGLVLVLEHGDGVADFTLLLRQVIPFASALQDKLVLHASAIETRDGIAAFIGASGAGKSTLGRGLMKRGFLLTADDLLPCRFDREQVFVPMAQDSGQVRRVPLTSIYFLSRDCCQTKMDLSVLGKMAHMRLLLENGFGELPIAPMWQVQFTAYASIVDSVNAFRLALPDDIGYLEEALDTLTRESFPVGDSSHQPLLKPLAGIFVP